MKIGKICDWNQFRQHGPVRLRHEQNTAHIGITCTMAVPANKVHCSEWCTHRLLITVFHVEMGNYISSQYVLNAWQCNTGHLHTLDACARYVCNAHNRQWVLQAAAWVIFLRSPEQQPWRYLSSSLKTYGGSRQMHNIKIIRSAPLTSHWNSSFDAIYKFYTAVAADKLALDLN